MKQKNEFIMKKNLFTFSSLILMLFFIMSGCKKDETTPDPAAKVVSAGKQIVYFKITSPAITGVIDTINKTITLAIPAGTSVTALITDISLAAGHIITPASGTAQNFTNPVVYTVKRPDNTSTTWTVTAVNSAVKVEQDITTSITWTADKVYTIDTDITINNGSVLTIEPGTVIKFGANGSLSIGYGSNATILANGTAAKPITFTSSALMPAAGAWEGLTFYDKTLNNSVLTYCNILYAGKNSTAGAVNILGCELTMNNCTISNSGSYGVYSTYSNSKGGFVTFNNNTINTTAKYGIVMNAQKISSIGTGNTFTDIKGIQITGDFNSSTPQTWQHFSAPYIVSDELDIDGSLTIAPGTTFRFDTNGWMEIGYYTTTTFIADGGAATTPITFTSSAATPTAGAWKGVVVYGNVQTTSKFNYCIIEYAGLAPTNMGALLMNGTASITFTNNIIRQSAGYGINMNLDAGFQAFSNNTISNCANHVIEMGMKHLPDLGTGNVLTAAAGKGIEVSGDVRYASPVTWRKQTADFYVKGGEIDVDGIVTIEAGSKFLFVNDSYFWFGYYENTKITAEGTATSKITFTTASASPAAGTWRGLYFDGFVQTNSSLAYCQFQYTGMLTKPAIYVETSFPVSNTTISDFSSTHAAEYKTGITMPSGTGNNFTWFAN